MNTTDRHSIDSAGRDHCVHSLNNSNKPNNIIWLKQDVINSQLYMQFA